MMTKEKVLSVGYAHGIYNCRIMRYQKGDIIAIAPLAEQLSVKEGDTVWIFHNDRLNYKGFCSVAVLHA